MGERILLINPIRRRKSRKAGASKTLSTRRPKSTRKRPLKKRAGTMARRTAAQRRATRKLVALNRSRRRLSNPVRRRRRARARRRNPVSKSAAYRSTSAMTGRASNPVRRRRRRRRNPASYSSNPIRRRRRRVARRRRNPLRIPRGGKIMGMFAPAATAAAGALMLDVLMGYATPYLPANFVAGPMKVVAKSAGAIAMSWVAGKIVSQSTARALGVGALTVVFHDLMKQLVSSAAPTLKMDGIGYYSPGYPAGGYMDGVGVYVGPQGTARSGLPMAGMGEYVNGMSRFDTENQYYNY